MEWPTGIPRLFSLPTTYLMTATPSPEETPASPFQSQGPETWKRASLDRHISELNRAHKGHAPNPDWINWLRDNLPSAITSHVAACRILGLEPVAEMPQEGPIL